MQDAREDADRRWESLNAILQELLQPESTLSLNEAVDRAANFYNDDPDHGTTIVASLNELAGQLPYDNPGHLKLAQFYCAFVDSGKWLAKSRHQDDPAKAKTILHDRMNICICDSVPQIMDEPSIEDTDVMEYVNAQAFHANLHAKVANLIWYLERAMDDAFKFDNSMELLQVQEGLIMGAAQWPIWAGPSILPFVQRPQRRKDLGPVKEDGAKKEDEAETSTWLSFSWNNPRKGEERAWKRQRSSEKKVKSKWPITWEQWQTWKHGFSAAAGSEMYGETCRKKAQEAADLMALQEKGMQKTDIEKH